MKFHSGSAAIWIADNCHFLPLTCVPREITAGCQSHQRRAGWGAVQQQLQAAQLSWWGPRAARSPAQVCTGCENEWGQGWSTTMGYFNATDQLSGWSCFPFLFLQLQPSSAADWRKTSRVMKINSTCWQGGFLQLRREFLGLKVGSCLFFCAI